MRTLHDSVLDAPPDTRPALPAFALGALPQPADRAGGARPAKRKSAEDHQGSACERVEGKQQESRSLAISV